MNIGIYIYTEAEVLDFSGPFEVFSTASRLSESKDKLNIFLVSECCEPVIARGGYSVNPSYGFNNHPQIDVLIVSGGIYINELKKLQVIEWISRTVKMASLVTSVCTGAFLLAEAGLLDGLNVTTHWEDIDDLHKSYPALKVHESRRWVADGKVITSGGISAGIDMSLHMISQIFGNELAYKTARQMEFDWTKNAGKCFK